MALIVNEKVTKNRRPLHVSLLPELPSTVQLPALTHHLATVWAKHDTHLVFILHVHVYFLVTLSVYLSIYLSIYL